MQYTLLGLNLLRLLANNQIADFHTEVELIPTEMLDNSFIKHPVLLEQYLMEGSYTKIIESRQEVPSSSYTYLMDPLIQTVRYVILVRPWHPSLLHFSHFYFRCSEEIAFCSEKAYPHLSVDHAKQLFILDQNQLAKFCEAVRVALSLFLI